MSERQLDAYLQAREALRRARAVASLTAAVRPPPPKPSPSAPWARQRSSGHWLSAEGASSPLAIPTGRPCGDQHHLL